MQRGKRILAFLLVFSITWSIWLGSTRPAIRRNPVASACAPVTFERERFTVCTYDPTQHEFAMVLSNADGTPLRSFSKLAELRGAASRRIIFALNGGMYDLAVQPIGLYVENGITRHAINQRDGTGNFHMKPNGVFWIDAEGAHVSPTERYAATRHAPLFATQSGPMLLIDGQLHPQFAEDGPSRNIRNAVCSVDGQAIQFVISDDPVSFGKLARFMGYALHCRNALYLDGLVSSLWDAASGRIDQKFPLGPLIVVSTKPPR